MKPSGAQIASSRDAVFVVSFAPGNYELYREALTIRSLAVPPNP